MLSDLYELLMELRRRGTDEEMVLRLGKCADDLMVKQERTQAQLHLLREQNLHLRLAREGHSLH